MDERGDLGMSTMDAPSALVPGVPVSSRLQGPLSLAPLFDAERPLEERLRWRAEAETHAGGGPV